MLYKIYVLPLVDSIPVRKFQGLGLIDFGIWLMSGKYEYFIFGT